VLEFAEGTRITTDNPALPGTGRVVVGIRPEKIGLFAEKGEGRLHLKIDLIEKLGAGELLYSSIGDEPFVITLPDSSAIDLNECWAEFSSDQLYLFSADSDQRLGL